MLSHVVIGIQDFERAFAFYQPLMAALGTRLRFSDASKNWAGWMPADAPRPLFLMRTPHDGQPASCGNGNMVAFDAPTREMVDTVYALALSLGGTCEGPPGLRAHYHPHYYGAYFRDTEGNKLCVVCHHAQD